MAAGDILTNVRKYLVSVAAITTLAPANRILARPMQQGETGTGLVLKIVSGDDGTTLTEGSKIGEAVLQIDAYATTPDAAAAASEAVRVNLLTYNGTAGDDTIRSVVTEPGSLRTQYESPRNASDAGRYRHGRDYRIFYVQPAVSV